MNKKPSRRAASAPSRRHFEAPEDTGVYPPREDTYLLLPFAAVPPGTLLADVGTGRGLAALAAARAGARVVATDLNRVALRRLCAEARSKGWDVEVVHTDLLRGLGRFDRILANPPYLPTTPEERDPDPHTNLALDGGPDGCRVFSRLVRSLGPHLHPDGNAFVVVSSVQDATAQAAILNRWKSEGGSWSVAASRPLEGEWLKVLRLWRPTRRGGARIRRAAPRR